MARVQAIVRMRLQCKEYRQLRHAALTVQHAWRSRSSSGIAASGVSHERISRFLDHMFFGPSKRGGF